jgi:hypothetical protein
VALSRQQLHALAAGGAAARIAELEAEIAAIRSEFPGAGRASRGRKAGRPARRKRRKMSAEARKKISNAQKRRWAAQKKAAKK